VTRKPGRPRDDQASDAITRAALELFAGQGLAGATMDGIASRAGVGRSTVYRRWSSPEQAVLAALDEVRRAGEDGAQGWEEWALPEVLDAFAERAAAALVDPGAVALLRQLTALPLDHPIARAHREGVAEPRRTAFTRMLVKARDAGELAADLDVELAQELLEGALLHRALVAPPVGDVGVAREQVEELLRAVGLCPVGTPTGGAPTP
jgi:AcrR family transcriptional regulator